MARESDFTPLIKLPRWSFGLRQLFLWTAAVALGLVALRNASTMWVAAMLALTLAVLAASILLVVFRRGPLRAYWIGFATFGWLYMLLLATSWQPIDPNALNNDPLRPHNLITQQLSSTCYHWLYDKAFEKYYAASNPYYPGAYGGGSMGVGSYQPGSYGSAGMMPGGMPMGARVGALIGGSGGTPAQPPPMPGPHEGDFNNVAHSLWTFLLAALGGCLGYWLYTTGPGRNEGQMPAAA